VGMGILPLQYKPGESAESRGLRGRETFSVRGLEVGIVPGQDASLEVVREDGSSDTFPVTVRIDQVAEVAIFGHGGILPMVLREALASG
jgi:aconitate hydratase